jgi:hypothetical protein
VVGQNQSNSEKTFSSSSSSITNFMKKPSPHSLRYGTTRGSVHFSNLLLFVSTKKSLINTKNVLRFSVYIL